MSRKSEELGEVLSEVFAQHLTLYYAICAIVSQMKK